MTCLDRRMFINPLSPMQVPEGHTTTVQGQICPNLCLIGYSIWIWHVWSDKWQNFFILDVIKCAKTFTLTHDIHNLNEELKLEQKTLTGHLLNSSLHQLYPMVSCSSDQALRLLKENKSKIKVVALNL